MLRREYPSVSPLTGYALHSELGTTSHPGSQSSYTHGCRSIFNALSILCKCWDLRERCVARDPGKEETPAISHTGGIPVLHL